MPGITRSTAALVAATAFLAFVPGAVADPGEVGTVTTNQTGSGQWHSVALANTYTTPVVVMGPPSINGGNPSIMRVRNVAAGGFEFQIDEWDYLDGSHGTETIGYLAVEAGADNLANGARIEAAVQAGVTEAWTTVNLNGFTVEPLVFVQCVTANEAGAVTVRVRNVSTTSFEIRLQEEEAADGVHLAEEVAWVAVEPGTQGGTRQYEAANTGNIVDEAWEPIAFAAAGYSATSPFLATMQTFGGADPAVLRYRNLGATSVEMKVEEEASNDPEVAHADEEVGYWVFQTAGSLPFDPSPPDAVEDTIVMNPGGKATLQVLLNDFDPDGDLDAMTMALAGLPAEGTVSIDPLNGTITYENTGATVASDSFSYTVADLGGLVSNPAQVTVTFDSSDRLPNTTLRLPAELGSIYTGENAFAGLSFSQPLALRTVPGDTQRLFVVEKTGKIWEIPDVTAPTPQKVLFLDLVADVLNTRPAESLMTMGEQGLLSMEFHPDFVSNGWFFVFYTPGINAVRHDRLSRFTVTGGSVDLSSEKVLFDQFDEAGNHNGGDMHFGDDGYLYLSLGDEGGANDIWNNSQTITKDFFSGVFRLDVDRLPANLEPNVHPAIVPDGANAAYKVPADNPWVGATTFNGASIDTTTVRTEFWAVGLRNPWRMSFDSLTGDLYLADVGQSAREEVNVITKGGNYGWAFREGFIPGGKSGQTPAGWTGDDPIHDYPRSEGTSVTGGVVYRGSNFPDLYGRYIFCDYNSGSIWALQPGVGVEVLAIEAGVAGFGTDPSNGDVLLCDLGDGVIRRLVPDTVSVNALLPPNLTQTGAFADLQALAPNPGLAAYEPNVSFWSDYAIKSRWFSVPSPADTMTWTRDGPWVYPEGMVWVKHFDLELERGNPASRERVETRFLVKTAGGSYGVSYQWNAGGTEAFLVPEGGADLSYQVDIGGGSMKSQDWRIPSRSECLQCHTTVAGSALSFNTRQLNRDFPMFGTNTNQVAALEAAGYFDARPEPVNTLPRFAAADDTTQSREFRVRSYLAVNCVQCHQPGANAPNTWDARPEPTLGETLLVNGVANNNGGNPAHRLVVPGDPASSILLSRIKACCGFSAMPPLGSNERNLEAEGLLEDWIGIDLAGWQSYQQWRFAQFGDDTSPEGEKTADADRDGDTNEFEYLVGTDPLDPSDRWEWSVDFSGGMAAFTFARVPNRSFQLWTSPGLDDWQPWDVPGNRPDFRVSPPALDVLQGPADPGLDPDLFFRWEVRGP